MNENLESMGASPLQTKNLSFGNAIDAVKTGKLVARQGWNGKGMFIFMRPADTLDVEFIVDKVRSLPSALKSFYAGNNHNGNPVTFTAYLCMKAADGTIVNGWLASQTDMLSNDWEILPL